MRQIGTVGTRPEAQRLAAYLLTRGIKSQIDPDGERFSVWVFEEDQLQNARQDFARFVENPNSPEILAAEEAAAGILEEQLRQRRNQPGVIDLRERWVRPAPASQPITMLLIAASIGITFLTDFGAVGQAGRRNRQAAEIVDKLRIASFQPTLREIEAEGLSQIREGEVWRLFTPIFLHFSMAHILFNMMWLYDLGMLIEFRRGALRLIVLVLLLAAISNLCQYWWQYRRLYEEATAPMLFGGMSGVVYGLLGYVWIKSRLYPSLALQLSPNSVLFALIFLVICMFGWMGPIANAAHISGFATGIVLGLVPFL